MKQKCRWKLWSSLARSVLVKKKKLERAEGAMSLDSESDYSFSHFLIVTPEFLLWL